MLKNMVQHFYNQEKNSWTRGEYNNIEFKFFPYTEENLSSISIFVSKNIQQYEYTIICSKILVIKYANK